MDFYSPLRYPGGKGKLADFVKTIFRDNLLCDGYYVEPYAGGASIALSLLFTEYASRVVINDIDRSIYAFWYSVINKTDELCRLVDRAKLDINEWRRQRSIQQAKEKAALLDLGFSTLYLNRTNYSGVIKGGVIGGLNQSGKWKIDARFNKGDLVERVKRIATYKSRIELHNLDACELLSSVAKKLPMKTLFYLDPPYYVKGRALYVNHYQAHDHAKVARSIKKFKRPRWIVSYDYTPEIVSLYEGLPRLEYSINYSAARATKGKEVMFFSENMVVPNIVSPIASSSRNTH